MVSSKGAAYERQLKKMLEGKGFFVIRSAGSGVDSTSPDLLALSSAKRMAIECKARNSGYVWIEATRMRRMNAFEEKTAIPYYVAWKVAREEWRFFPLIALRETAKAFVIEEKDLHSGLSLEQLLNR
ncbi:hypothetical protein KJ765_04245 [Candidatus Micrarchaeota archaeon]|nr:hypothetical protein [Candidatus Micrarchaeota archaeon]